MVLKRKLGWVKTQARAKESTSVHPVTQFVQLCQKVTGEQNTYYKQAVAEIYGVLPQAKSAIEDLMR